MNPTIVYFIHLIHHAVLVKTRAAKRIDNGFLFNPIVLFLFIIVYALPVKTTGQGSKKVDNELYDTLWLSDPNLISKNGNSEPCFALISKVPSVIASTVKVSLAQQLSTIINGSITYDYQYRSLIDTPVYTKNFQQHTVSADIRILYKGIYPVNLRFQVRKSNQPLFKDFVDINFRFDPRDFSRVIENRIKAVVRNRPLPGGLQQLQQLADRLKEECNRLNAYVNSPATLQKIIEARERNLFKQAVRKGKQHLNSKLTELSSDVGKPHVDSIDKQLADSAQFLAKEKLSILSLDSIQSNLEDSTIIYQYEQSKERLATLQADIKKAEDSLRQTKKNITDSLQKLESVLNSVKGGKIQELIHVYRIPDDSLPSGYRKLLAIRQMSAGRSMINYSELTAKNVSITGVNIEYDPSWYAAVAIGFTDWQFRDFRTIRNKLPKQYLALGRFGWGDRDKSSLIFTYFTGRRNLLAQYGTGNNGLTSFNISGMSIEGIYHPTPNQQFSIEIAKSSYPKYAGNNPVSGKPFENNWFTMDDRHNEAYSVAYKGEFIKTKTAVQGSYKKVGQYFQSYAFYNSPGQQDAWNLQLDQRIKKWATLRGGLQKNQYSFPMLAGGLKNNIVFKTAQATIHYKRWPVLMVGYYPSSQITLVNNEIPVENRFYTLNVSVNHSYNALKTYMNSTLVYTRFYNESTDTGFIYYNAKNISLTQMAWIGKWSLQGSYTAIWQNLGRLNVLEAFTSFKASEAFGISGGIKYNSLLDVTDVLGYSAGFTLVIKKLGALQAMMDKSYWPGQQRNLLPNSNGRVTFIKTF